MHLQHLHLYFPPLVRIDASPLIFNVCSILPLYLMEDFENIIDFHSLYIDKMSEENYKNIRQCVKVRVIRQGL